MRLPGWSFLLVGALMIGYISFIESRAGTNLTFFTWIAILMIVYGVAKEILPRVLAKPKEKKLHAPPKKQPDEHVHDHRHPAGNAYHGKSHHATHAHVRPNAHPSHPHVPAHKVCPRCHTQAPASRKMCHTCGWAF